MSAQAPAPMIGRIIVMENGRFCSRVGFSGEKTPRSVFPTLFGAGMGVPVNPDAFRHEFYVGEDALTLRGVLRLGYPVECNGSVEDEHIMEKIWAYAFTQLNVNPRGSTVFFVIKPNVPPSTLEKIADVMFNTFEIAQLAIADQAVLALTAMGQKTGCVVDIGDSETVVMPVEAGKVITSAMQRTELAGKEIGRSLEVLLRAKGFAVRTSAEREIVRDIKEKLCYIALDPEREIALVKAGDSLEKQYMLPDGDYLPVGSERFMAPEILFQPELAGKSIPPLEELIWSSIEKCGVSRNSRFLSNILLTGGSAFLPNLQERLNEKLKNRVPRYLNVQVSAPPNRAYLGWCGGSLLSSRVPMTSLFVDKSTYAEKKVGELETYVDRVAQLLSKMDHPNLTEETI